MRKIILDDAFDCFGGDERSAVFQVFPPVFGDSRGYFAETFKSSPGENPDKYTSWLNDCSWIKQMNRSMSKGGTVRGCHAQKGQWCQGKLVQAVTRKIYDVITDARPDSGTFGTTKVFALDPETQNQLWVPRGFLHAFAVPEGCDDAVFEYWCDNVYNKESETGVNPKTLLPDVAMSFKSLPDMPEFDDFIKLFDDSNKLLLSEKDEKNQNYADWMNAVKSEYETTGKVWYK